MKIRIFVMLIGIKIKLITKVVMLTVIIYLVRYIFAMIIFKI